MYKTYLVTGATGFLGRTVVSELLSRGASVRALVLPGDRLAGVLPRAWSARRAISAAHPRWKISLPERMRAPASSIRRAS